MAKKSNDMGRQRLIAGLCLWSGAFGLVYQVLWIRLFSLSLGATSLSLALVSAFFFCGLALGSRLGGRVAGTLKNPLKFYGALETAIAAIAFSLPSLRHVVELASPDELSLRASSALLILLATIPMGCVLPVLTPYFAKKRGDGRPLSYMCGINTLGACMGSLLAGFVGIRYGGVALTNTVAAFLNGAVGLAVWFMADRWGGSVGVPHPDEPKASPVCGTKHAAGTMVTAFLAGTVFMAWETFFVRYLGFYFRDTAFLYVGILATVIFVSGAGDFVFGSLLKKYDPAKLFVYGNVAGTLFAVSGVFAALWGYAYVVDLERHPMAQFVFIGILVGLPALLFSVNMPVLLQRVSRERDVPGATGALFCVNTLGSMGGALLFSLSMFPVWGMTTALRFLVALSALMIACHGWGEKAAAPRRPGVMAAGLLLLVGYGAGCGPDIPQRAFRQKLRAELGPWYTEASIPEIREGSYGTSWIAFLPGGERLLFSERVIISRDRSAGFRTEGFLPILAAERLPRRVLSLCFGGGLSTVAAGLLPRAERFVMVDISSDNMELALKYFADNERWKTDPRAEFCVEDAFRFVRRSTEKFDLILAEPTPPYFGYRGAALYTEEFFRAAAQRLAPGGIFSMPLPCGQLTPDETRHVMRTFAEVFPHCRLWWNGVDPLMMGTAEAMELSASRFEELADAAGFLSELARISGSAALHEKASLPAALLLVDADFRSFSASGEIYRLDRPGLEFSQSQAAGYSNLVEIFANLSSASAVRESVGARFMPDAYWKKEFDLRRRRLLNTSVRMAGNIG